MTRVTKISQCTPGEYLLTAEPYHPGAQSKITIRALAGLNLPAKVADSIRRSITADLKKWIDQKRLYKL